MPNHDIIRVRHMLDAAQEASSFVSDKSRADLDANRMLALSLVKSIEIVGEAASKVSAAFREAHPEMYPCIFRVPYSGNRQFMPRTYVQDTVLLSDCRRIIFIGAFAKRKRKSAISSSRNILMVPPHVEGKQVLSASPPTPPTLPIHLIAC